MRVGIVGAMPEEIELIKADLSARSEAAVGLRRYFSGTLEGREVVIVLSRCGKVAAASTVTTLIERFGVDLVVFTGVAGAVAPKLSIGDVVVADHLVQHDMDASALPMFRRFEIPLLGVTSFPVDPACAALAVEAAREFFADDLRGLVAPALLERFGIREPAIETGLVASGDRFIAGQGEADELRRALPRLQCVEMEGAAAAQVCHEHGVPIVVVRAISDRADHSAAVDFSGFIREVASVYARGIVRRFLHRIR